MKSFTLALAAAALLSTPALAALKAGAHGLKLFPAELASPSVVKALLAVLPKRRQVNKKTFFTPSLQLELR